jgi:hypothetical protein
LAEVALEVAAAELAIKAKALLALVGLVEPKLGELLSLAEVAAVALVELLAAAAAAELAEEPMVAEVQIRTVEEVSYVSFGPETKDFIHRHARGMNDETFY